MKRSNLALTAIVVVAAGLIGSYGIQEFDSQKSDGLSSMGDKAGLSGHVILTVKDSTGAIKHYQQTDNIITALGKDCTGFLLFGLTGACTDTGLDVFTDIALSSSSLAEVASTADLTEIDQLPGLLAGNGFDRGAGTQTVGVDASGTTNARADIVKTYSAGAIQTVNAAALFDSSSSQILAAKNFDQAVGLGSGDTLEVTWQITLG